MPRRIFFLVSVLLASLALTSCKSATTAALPTPESIYGYSAPAVVQPTPAPPVGEAHPALIDLEAGVDVIFAQVPNDRWDEVSAQVSRMSAAWYARGAEVSAAGAPQAALNSLDAALADLAAQSAARDAAGTLQAANLVSAAVADLYDVFLPLPTSDLRRLAMLERQLGLDAEGGDPQIIQGDLAQLKAIWERLGPQIRRDGGSAFADQFDASLAAQAKFIEANDRAGLKEEIKRGWQLIILLR